MPLPHKLFDGVKLTTATVTYYTVPPGTRTMLCSVTITNTTTDAVSVAVDVVRAAATLTESRSLAGGATAALYEAANHVLEAGDRLQMRAGAGASLTAAAEGVEISNYVF